MLHPETHRVTDTHGPRPAGRPDECFYCNTPVGQVHTPECVMRNRTVVMRMVTEVTVEVPENWDVDMVEFKYNGSSWCASNILSDLESIDCICPFTRFEYLREATEEDDKRWAKENLLDSE